MLLIAYLGAVISKWKASVGGFAALAIGFVVRLPQPGWWTWPWPLALKPDDPWLWWTIGSGCFVVAMFQAWSDEHVWRVALEQKGPQIALEYKQDKIGGFRRWVATNSGDSDALNIVSDEMVSPGATAKVVRVQRLGKGTSEGLVFEQSLGGGRVGPTSSHPNLVVDSIKKGLSDAVNGSDPDAGVKFVHALTDLALPLRLTYSDASGARFESVGRIRWNAVIDNGHFEVLRWGRVRSRGWWANGAQPSLS